MAVYRPNYRDKKTGAVKQSAVWWIDMTLAGKRIQESTKTSRKTLAVEYQKRRRRELEQGLAGVTTEVRRLRTVSDAIHQYVEAYAIGHRPKSVAWVQERIAHLERLLGNTMLPDLGEERVRTYMKKRLVEGVGNRTVNMEVDCLSRAIGRTWRQLWPKLTRLEEPDDVGKALEPDQERCLLEAAICSRSMLIHPFIRMALLTGMRMGEIRSLQWMEVNFNGRTVTVAISKSEAGSGRVIPIGDELLSVLVHHAAWYESRFGECKPQWYVFPFGDPPRDPSRSVTTIKKAWGTATTRAGISCRFHDLRHTFATKLAEAGVPESTMLALMGHMSRKMLERYSHIRMAAKRDAIRAVEAVLLAPPKVSPKVDANSTGFGSLSN